MALALPASIFLAAVLTLSSVFGLPSAGLAQTPRVDVVVDPAKTVGVFNASLLGANLQWTDAGDGLLDPAAMALRLDALAAVRKLPVASVRFPGGLLSSAYEWEKGVGDPAKRGTGRTYGGGQEKMLFGSEEYLSLLKAIKAEGFVTVNAKKSADEAVKWQAYLNKTGLNVKRWEFGNESFLTQDPSFMKAAEYVRRFKEFSAAIKAGAPGVSTLAILEGSLIGVPWGKVVVPEIGTWNATVVKELADVADAFATHLYAPFNMGKSDEETARAILAAPAALEANLAVLNRLRRAQAPGKPLWVTEFNVGIDKPEAAWRFGVSLAQSAFVGGLLLAYVRQDVEGAHLWSLVGNHNFGLLKTGQDPRQRPAAKLYSMVSPLAGASALQTTVAGPPLSHPELGNVPRNSGAAVADALIFVKDKRMLALAVNRDPTRPASLGFRLADGSPLAVVKGQILTGPNYLSNNETSESVVVLPLQPADKLELPPASTALVELRDVRRP